MPISFEVLVSVIEEEIFCLDQELILILQADTLLLYSKHKQFFNITAVRCQGGLRYFSQFTLLFIFYSMYKRENISEIQIN